MQHPKYEYVKYEESEKRPWINTGAGHYLDGHPEEEVKDPLNYTFDRDKKEDGFFKEYEFS